MTKNRLCYQFLEYVVHGKNKKHRGVPEMK
jgi:hypothetical protein